MKKKSKYFLENDKTLATYLIPFMVHSISEEKSELELLVQKGLIYDLLVKISGHEVTNKINLEPLIVSLGTAVDEAEDEEKSEEIEISYSTHLKDREEVLKTLKGKVTIFKAKISFQFFLEDGDR